MPLIHPLVLPCFAAHSRSWKATNGNSTFEEGRGLAGGGPAATVLTLTSAEDFIGSGGAPMPVGEGDSASLTTNAPFGTAIRSGGPHGDTGCSIAALLTPGVTVETVAFSYRQLTGYATTGPGPNFTLTVAGTTAFRSTPLDHNHPYPHKGTRCTNGDCYSPAIPVKATGLGIKVPTAGPQRVAFAFHNTGTNLQLLLPMTVTIGCGDSVCSKAPPPPPPPPPHIAYTIKAKVPGDLITDLQAASLVGDPLYELNFMNASIWDSYTWTYSTAFTMAADRLDRIRAAGGSHLLIFDGVKMGANIKLNGKVVGQTTDQFLRYEFPLDGTLLQAGVGANTLTVEFDPSIDCQGRWMACTGGWDWAPYTNTKSFGKATFSKGVWRSVYIAEVTAVAIKHVVPQITYLGEYPTAPLSEGTHGGFKVDVKVHLWGAAKSSTGTLKVTGSWGQTASTQVTVPAGDFVSNVTINAAAADIKLWWPAGHGAQPLYNVTVTFEPTSSSSRALLSATASASASASAAVSATRRIGFRMFALVTGNDTNPEWLKNNTNGDGTDTFGMYWRINGAAILAKGANMIPMEELEGRMSADAHYQIVLNAMEGRMNTLRLWGGGIFMPRAWYDACDELGIMVYHDMMYCDQGGHSPANTPVQDAELRHNIRQLSNHPSIVMWDGGNECRSCGIYTTFVMTVLAQEDSSRSVWPSSPASGWGGGVNTLTSIPNGKLLTPAKIRKGHEQHGFYTHGGGFPAVNGQSTVAMFASGIPLAGRQWLEPNGHFGLSYANTFTSEFGVSGYSSFESMSGGLDEKHWGIHGGMPGDTCRGGHDPNNCVGDNPMSGRNYPCDNIIEVYFGKSNFDLVGADAFKKQLWQCMIGQALLMKQTTEGKRLGNRFGVLTWQLNEIWPTGGWGSLEYGTVGWTKGQVLGGRWKPLQYWYRSTIYTDVMATCGTNKTGAPNCLVKNDLPVPFKGNVVISSIDFATGNETAVKSMQLDMAAGPGVVQQFDLGATVNANGTMLHAVVKDSAGAVVNNNFLPFTEPKNFALPKANVQFTVAKSANADGSVDITVITDKVAVYLTFTTLAQGRFSDNAFVMLPGTQKIQFLPIQGFLISDLTSSLRAEHVASYM
eukprot:COSAG06_NODE_108_length_23594_cov_43.013450_12_plen_1117_part_00